MKKYIWAYLFLVFWSSSLNSQCAYTATLINSTCGSIGGYSFTITNPTACAGFTPTPPYTLVWANVCSNVPTLTVIPGPGTYSCLFTSTCSTPPQINILDNGANLVGFVFFSSGVTNGATLTMVPTTQTLPTCFGFCNGSRGVFFGNAGGNITATVDPGLPSQVIYPSFPQGSKTFTSVCAGNHTVYATDLGYNCTYTSGLTFSLSGPTQVSAAISFTNPNCNNANNGSISIVPSGGTPNYTIGTSAGTLTGASNSTVSFTPFTAGPVTATITDSKGCTLTANATLTNPPAYTVTTTQANISCPNNCTATAAVTVSGGVQFTSSPFYSYTWSPSGGTASSASSLCAGGYTVNISDALNCPTVATFSITQPASVSISTSITNVSCNTFSNGSATVALSAGTASTITWQQTSFPTTFSANTTTVSSLPAGNYTVYVQPTTYTAGGANCNISQTVSITQPSAFVTSTLTQSITCISSPGTGAATVNVSGSNGPPFSYTWSPGAMSGSVATGLNAISYTISIKDASNCSTTASVTITQPASFVVNTSSTNITCNSFTNGSINSVTVTGGTSPYSFTLVTPLSASITSVASFTGLGAGNYVLWVRDASSATCAQSVAITFTAPNPLNTSINTTSISCAGFSTGALGGSATGGTPTYSLSWSTSTGNISGGVLSNIGVGTYTFNVRDANNCTVSAVATLTQPSSMTVTVANASVSCFGGNNANLNAVVSGGSPGYTYVWSNGPTTTFNNGLGVGSYTCVVTDIRSCTAAATASVGSPTAIVLSTLTASTSCAGSCDGSATITASGGTSPFVFSVSSGTINSSGVSGSHCMGSYNATVTDANSCPSATVFNIGSPTLLSAAITGTQNTCAGATGAATVQGSNGTPSYTFAWTNSVNATVATAATATGLASGNYTATVTDSKGCIATATTFIQQTIVSPVATGGTLLPCFGNTSGTAVVSATGGVTPYTYTWSPGGQNTSSITGLGAGTYTVVVKEGGANCTSSTAITITAPPALTVSGTSFSLTCFNVCTGSITSNVTGGTGPFTYSWSPGSQTSSSLTSQCAGGYTLRVVDVNGCTVSPTTFSITQPASITANFTLTPPTTCTTSNGALCVNASGGSGAGYTYTWSPGASTSSCIVGQPAGPYSVTIKDGTGICSTTSFTTLTTPSGPSVTSVTQQSLICNGVNSGSASVLVTGTATPFTYSWSPSGGTSFSMTSAPTGTYLLTITDANSCVTTQSVNLATAPAFTLTQNVTNAKCGTGSTGSINTVPSGGSPAYTYSWSGPGGPFGNTQAITSLTTGVFNLIITDANSCARPFTFTVNAPPALTLTTVSTHTAICLGSTSGSLAANGSGGTSPITYSWTPLGAFNGSITTTIFNIGAGIYTVTITDANQCTTSATHTLAQSTLTGGVTFTNTTCSNSCNAVANLTVSGGAPTYSFSWSSSASTASTISNLCVGNYTGSITDANGCVIQKGFTISPASPFSISVVPSNPKCNSVCNGSIATTPSGGTGTITYSWSPSGSGQNPTGLCSGIYALQAVDGNSCMTSTVVTLSNPPAILANITTTNPACAGDCNGIVVTTPTNAVGTVSVVWSASTAINSKTLTGQCTGTNYAVTITDANGCVDTQTYNLSTAPAMSVNFSSIPAACTQSNGAITLIPTGGSPGYNYTWTPIGNPNISIGNTISATGIPQGTYAVVVRDVNNCSVTANILLSNSNGPTAPISSTNAICSGTCNGQASVGVVSSATTPLTPVWLSPINLTASTAPSLCAGTYTVKLADVSGCITFTTATVTSPSSITIVPNLGLPQCNGVCNGSISLLTTGGVPGYTYNWTPAAPNSSVRTNLCAGNYSVNIVHKNGQCTQTFTYSIPASVNIAFTNTIVPNNCFGNTAGMTTVAVTPTPGIPSPFIFSWSNGNTTSGGLTSSQNSLSNGLYSVTATGANGCFNVYTVNITSPTQLTLNASVTQPSCGMCNGSSTVTAGGGSGSTYTLNWSTGATSSVVSNLCAGVYNINILDNNGCTQSQSVTINNSSSLTSTINVSNIPCNSSCTGSATIIASGGNAPITYNWLSPSSTGTSITNLCPGTYMVQIQDAQGCVLTNSAVITAATNITISPTVLPPTCGLTNGTIQISAAGGTPTYNFSWLPSGSTGTVNNVGPGSYTVTVTDSSPGGCATTTFVNVSNKNAPTVVITQSNINCFNACTGAATANVTGTATPFIYNWSNGGNNNIVTNLCQGIISFTVTDANICKAIISTSISQSPSITLNLPIVNQPSCGLCNGGATVQALGGTQPFTYTWSSGATGTTITNLCAGIFQLNVKDALGCTQPETVIINNSNGITGHTITTKDIPCNSSCNGAATVMTSGGTSPISFNWVTPASTSSVISNLCTGNYFVQMQDAQGCIRSGSATINAATNITVTPVVKQPGCGLSNGSVGIVVTGGVPTYSISWLPVSNSTGTITNLGPGSYTVSISDSGTLVCMTSSVFNISNSNAPSVSIVKKDIDCFGQCTGAATANVTGSATPFTYNWSGNGNASTLTNLCNGVITLTVTDTNTCSAISSVTIVQNPQLVLDLPNISQPTCGRCNGAVVVNALGGVAPYTYSWTSGVSGFSLNNLCAGLYQVQVTDLKNCTQNQNVTINSSNGITGQTINKLDVQCLGTCNGAATITAVGGSPPITYNWINPNLPSTTPTVNNLCAGIYFVQMTDNFGCIRTASTNILAATNMTVTSNTSQPGCNNQNNGVIGVSVSGGTSPYTYSWSPGGASTATVNNLGPGVYTVTIKDQNGAGCTKVQTFNLSNLNGPSITETQSNVSCFGMCDGGVTVTPSGTATTTYSWSIGGSSATQNSLCGGVVTLTASANGCSTIKTYTISQNPALELHMDISQITCQNKCDGLIALLPVGGKLQYTFNGTSSPSTNITTTLCVGSYSVRVTDANGCKKDSIVQLKNPTIVTNTINSINSSCGSVADGAATVTTSGGRLPYKYSWSGPSAFTSSNISINNIYSGNYTLSVTDTLGCKRDTVLKIKTLITIEANAGPDTIVCPKRIFISSADSSKGAVTYSWTQLPGNTFLANTSTFATSGVQAGSTYTYVLLVTSSVAGCNDRDTVVTKVYKEPYISAGQSFTIPVFSSQMIGGAPTVMNNETVTWTPSQNLNDPFAQNPVASNTTDITYTVSTMYGKGCIAFDTTRIQLFPVIKVHSGFSPNGDGKNDGWIISYIEQFPDNTVEIFNRWGESLFYSKGYHVPWDGKWKGKDLPVGTYYYIIKLNHPSYPKPYTGPVTVFR